MKSSNIDTSIFRPLNPTVSKACLSTTVLKTQVVRIAPIVIPTYGYPSNVVNKLKAKESKNHQNCDKNDNFGQKIKYVKTSMERNNHPSAN